jgi:hypothetical protein
LFRLKQKKVKTVLVREMVQNQKLGIHHLHQLHHQNHLLLQLQIHHHLHHLRM